MKKDKLKNYWDDKESTQSDISNSMKPETIGMEEYRAPGIKEISTNYSSKRKPISLGCWNCGGSESGAVHC